MFLLEKLEVVERGLLERFSRSLLVHARPIVGHCTLSPAVVLSSRASHEISIRSRIRTQMRFEACNGGQRSD